MFIVSKYLLTEYLRITKIKNYSGKLGSDQTDSSACLPADRMHRGGCGITSLIFLLKMYTLNLIMTRTSH